MSAMGGKPTLTTMVVSGAAILLLAKFSEFLQSLSEALLTLIKVDVALELQPIFG